MMHRSQGLGKMSAVLLVLGFVLAARKTTKSTESTNVLYISIHHYTSLYISIHLSPSKQPPPDGNVALSYVAQLWFILWFMVDIASIHGLFVQPTFTSPLDHASSSHLGPPPTTKHAEGQLWPWIDSESTAQFWRRNRRVQWMEIQP